MDNVAADEIPFVKNIFIVLALTAVTFTIDITVSVDFFLILDDKLRVKVTSHQVEV